MRRFAAFGAIAFLFAGCAQTGPFLSQKRVPDVAALNLCSGPSEPGCRFRNSPVRLENRPIRLPLRPLVFYPTAETLEFRDARNRSWIAPRQTLTDGASIPPIFVSIIGNPRSPEFANASAVHDAYCGFGNENGRMFHSVDWRSVHRMFYEALRVGGTPELKAKVMFAAVYIGGPRWENEWEGNATSGGAQPGPGPSHAGNRDIDDARMREVLRETIRFIGKGEPGLAEIEEFAEELLRRRRQAALQDGGTRDDSASDTSAGETAQESEGPAISGSGTPAGLPADGDTDAPQMDPGYPGGEPPANPAEQQGPTDPTTPPAADRSPQVL